MSSTNGAGASRTVSIEQAEALLRSLNGVAAARVMSGPHGKVTGVQIQTSGDTPAHQIVRNVQSALLARFGLLIDSALIEFVNQISQEPPAPTAAPVTIEAMEPKSTAVPAEDPRSDKRGQAAALDPAPPQPRSEATPPREPGPGLRPMELVERPAIERFRPNRIRCRVEIAVGSDAVTGAAEMLDGGDAALSVTARAVLAACRNADPKHGGFVELEGVRIVELAGHNYVLAAVRAVEPRRVHYLAGAAIVDATAEEAAALATIQAVQQWTTARKPSARDVPQ